jgi:hypothetical protein
MSMNKKLIGIFSGAILLLFFFILPAEYGYDPTGIGKSVGILNFSKNPEDSGEINTETIVIEGQYPVIPNDFDSWYPDILGEPFSKTHEKIFSNDTIIVELQSGEQVEYKALMEQGDAMIYSWSVDKGIVYTDFHADPTLNKDSYPDDYYIRYRESETANSSGSLVASFSGNHGWYWLNIEEHPIKITLEVSGFYSEIKELGRSFQ